MRGETCFLFKKKLNTSATKSNLYQFSLNTYN